MTVSSLGDLAVVELAQEVRHLLVPPHLGVVVLDLARRELVEPLDLDLVDHRVEDVLPRPEAGADEHRDDHPLLVLARLVAEPDRRGLAVRAKLGLDDRRVEVEGERGQRGAGSYVCSLSSSASARVRPSRARRGRRAAAAPRRAASQRTSATSCRNASGMSPSRPPLVADEEERDDLEHPLALPGEPVAACRRASRRSARARPSPRRPRARGGLARSRPRRSVPSAAPRARPAFRPGRIAANIHSPCRRRTSDATGRELAPHRGKTLARATQISSRGYSAMLAGTREARVPSSSHKLVTSTVKACSTLPAIRTWRFAG